MPQEENSKYFVEEQGPYLDNGKWYIKKYFYLDETLSGTPLKSQVEEVDAPTVVNKYNISLKNFLNSLIGTVLFNELNSYVKSSPAMELFFNSEYFTLEDINKIKAQLAIDLEASLITLSLKKEIENALDDVLARG